MHETHRIFLKNFFLNRQAIHEVIDPTKLDSSNKIRKKNIPGSIIFGTLGGVRGGCAARRSSDSWRPCALSGGAAGAWSAPIARPPRVGRSPAPALPAPPTARGTPEPKATVRLQGKKELRLHEMEPNAFHREVNIVVNCGGLILPSFGFQKILLISH